MKKLLKIVKIVLLVLLILAAALFAVIKISGNHRSDPAKIKAYETSNPFITGTTECIAHRCGAGLAPEESLAAMMKCLSDSAIEVDIFEFDLRLTADDVPVLFHDATLDRMTDAAEVLGGTEIAVRDVTLAQLQQLNVGEGFTDADGNHPYADEQLKVLTLSEALDCLTFAGVTRLSIEVKDAGDAGMLATDLLYTELSSRGLLTTTVYSSFKTDVSAYAAQTYPDLIRSNTDAEAVEFYLAAITNNPDYVPPCSVFQLPFTDKYLNMGVNFATAQVVNYAHSHNVALHYWTINDTERMEYLASLKVDGIMSDYPDLLCKTLG
ncbi:MAG: hypothetical protein IJC58_01215 [Oscillospiraceae bacterium]|nr:hypothetical protein [Oscillospiraceae bacterium]